MGCQGPMHEADPILLTATICMNFLAGTLYYHSNFLLKPLRQLGMPAPEVVDGTFIVLYMYDLGKFRRGQCI